MRCIIILFIFSSMAVVAQDKPDLENILPGVWKGMLYNDTTQKNIPYELAISEKNGRFSGYSHTIFMIDSMANIGVKDVSIKEKRGTIIVEDKKLIDNNYTAPPARGVHTTIKMQLSENDTAIVLSGTWSTNRTRQFNALTGTIWLHKKKEVLHTHIIPKLATLNLAGGLSFITAEMLHELAGGSLAHNTTIQKTEVQNETEEAPVMTIVEPELVISLPLPKDSNRPEKIDYSGINPDSIQKVNSISNDVTPLLVTTENIKDVPQPKDQNTDESTAINNEAPVQSANKIEKKDLSKRIVETIRTVATAADSLVFTLYDNGTVDGDTVSVLLNGKTILSRVGLSVQAVNKTIHLTPEMGDSINIVMYAENLGTLPPNTGLLIIREEGKNHEIRFSGDLRKNSAIILKRIKK